jgi:biopolymer transport protein ExbD
LAQWDIFHADRLELERALDSAAIRRALERGELRDDDLVRPAGTTVAWSRLAEVPELFEASSPPNPLTKSAPAALAPQIEEPATSLPEPSDYEVESADFGPDLSTSPPTLPSPDWLALRGDADDVAFPVINDQPADAASEVQAAERPEPRPSGGWIWPDKIEEDDDDFEEGDEPAATDDAGAGGLEILEDDSEIALPVPRSVELATSSSQPSRLALPVVVSRDWDDVPAEVDEEDEADLSLSRSGPATVEELDLAPMVDVAFQLVLFFMVTATTILYKTLEIPKPSAEQAPTAVAQGRSLADLQDDNVLVEVDAGGEVKIDREPVAPTMEAIVERLRIAREKTNRKSMLLSADFATKHRDTVLVIDAAHEIGMNIVIARPAAPQGPAPSLLAQPPAARPVATPKD